MILVSIMLWTVIFAQAVQAMAVGRADQSFDQSPLINEQPISSVIRPFDPVPHKYMVKLKDNVSDIDTHNHRESVAARQVKLASQLHPAHSFFEATAAEPQKYGGITDCLNATMNGYIGYFTDDMIDEILKSDLVDFIHQDGYLEPKGSPVILKQNEAIHLEQHQPEWHLARLSKRQLPEERDAIFKFFQDSGAGVDIHIFDSGVWNNHLEFQNFQFSKVRSGPKVFDTFEDRLLDHFEDRLGHGTCVASLAAGMYLGVAKQSVVYSSKVVNSVGRTQHSAMVVAFDRALNVDYQRRTEAFYQGAVINMSLGGPGGYSESDPMHIAINIAVESGIHVVVSAGNENSDACLFSPASNPHAITVGSSTMFDRKAISSNFGKCVDVYAPGDSVNCASNQTENKLVMASGTSMAAPVVAGIVAGILSYAPHSGTKYTSGTQISPADMKTLIKRIATPEAKNQLLSTEAIAYFGGTKEELDFFYHLLVNDPTGTKIQTPQFAVPPPSLKTSREILNHEEEAYKLFLAYKRKKIPEKNKSEGPTSSPTSTSNV